MWLRGARVQAPVQAVQGVVQGLVQGQSPRPDWQCRQCRHSGIPLTREKSPKGKVGWGGEKQEKNCAGVPALPALPRPDGPECLHYTLHCARTGPALCPHSPLASVRLAPTSRCPTGFCAAPTPHHPRPCLYLLPRRATGGLSLPRRAPSRWPRAHQAPSHSGGPLPAGPC